MEKLGILLGGMASFVTGESRILMGMAYMMLRRTIVMINDALERLCSESSQYLLDV
jgi:hypothetical protein